MIKQREIERARRIGLRPKISIDRLAFILASYQNEIEDETARYSAAMDTAKRRTLFAFLVAMTGILFSGVLLHLAWSTIGILQAGYLVLGLFVFASASLSLWFLSDPTAIEEMVSNHSADINIRKAHIARICGSLEAINDYAEFENESDPISELENRPNTFH